MSVAVSGFYIGLTAIMAVYFSWRVVKLRRGLKIGLGTDGNQALTLASRVHANLIENAPIVMALLLVAEMNGLAEVYIHLIGTVWLVARMLHAIGLTQGLGGYHFGRFWGVLLTWILILTLSVVNIGYFILG
ncbi:MAPEG family protein [Shewanella psychrotolerans]|uniref:MAPEG family protein n=1 Tax=Shewanella psychrotolerans TaxID=2864206 RepID=UPI001C6617AC|nr:MAPEG family protein [Shewanella psychrotolerans]QYK01630.1 MAPEG family protein [Shewanella psychrotolerans]